MTIGITGKYCSGKNRVAELLSRRGFQVIDVDHLGHDALVERRDAVVGRFGPGVLTPEGGIDRRRLGALVFADHRERAALEAILHPAMVAAVERLVASGDGRGASRSTGRFAVNAALLFPMGLHRLCDHVIYVRACLLVRIWRALRRDRLPLLQIARRIWSQRKLSPQSCRENVDTQIVKNSGAVRSLEPRLSRILAGFGVGQ